MRRKKPLGITVLIVPLRIIGDEKLRLQFEVLFCVQIKIQIVNDKVDQLNLTHSAKKNKLQHSCDDVVVIQQRLGITP
jgi:hypothetical protein